MIKYLLVQSDAENYLEGMKKVLILGKRHIKLKSNCEGSIV